MDHTEDGIESRKILFSSMTSIKYLNQLKEFVSEPETDLCGMCSM